MSDSLIETINQNSAVQYILTFFSNVGSSIIVELQTQYWILIVAVIVSILIAYLVLYLIKFIIKFVVWFIILALLASLIVVGVICLVIARDI